MPKRKEVLGSGRYGVVYGTTKYAIKQIDDKVVFDAEADAYCSLTKVESLRGRIPILHGIDRDRWLIYLQRINEQTLREKLPDESTLLQIQQYLLETISIIHECGWCHGDINLDNIFASGLLIDFSHAHSKSKLSAQAWEYFQKKDRRDVKSCYIQAIKLKNLEAAIALLDSGVDGLPHQAELAELLHQSKTSPELLKKLKKITDPTPSLALEMCRAFRLEGNLSTGMRLLRELDPLTPCDDQSRRLYVKIQGELALCESHNNFEKAYKLYTDAVRSSIHLLGRTDEDTIRLRVTFAGFLERFLRYSGALDVLAALKVDSKDLLHPWGNLVVQMEERLRYERVKKRHRERPMPAEQTLTEDDKENIPQSEPYSPSKKRKLV